MRKGLTVMMPCTESNHNHHHPQEAPNGGGRMAAPGANSGTIVRVIITNFWLNYKGHLV